MCLHLFVFLSPYLSVFMGACMHCCVCISYVHYIYIYVYMYIYIDMYIYIYSVCVCMYVCTFIHRWGHILAPILGAPVDGTTFDSALPSRDD